MTKPASTSKRGLGRGLAALLGEDAEALAPVLRGQAQEEGAAAPASSFSLAITELHPGPAQPRRHFDEAQLEALANSVRVQGVLQPILVRPHPDKKGAYEIVAGERRWRAAQKAQIHEVPVLVRELSDGQALELALVENVQRQDLDPIEEAEGYRCLIEEFKHSQEELARMIGKSRPYIANLLRLLNLPDIVKDLVRAGKLTAGHARALLGSARPEALAEKIIAKALSVRETERLVAAQKPEADSRELALRGRRRQKDADTLSLEEELSRRLGVRVRIDPRGGGGILALHYQDLDQLDVLLQRLRHEA